MPKLVPTDWRTLVKIFKADGFIEKPSTGGSHVTLEKPGVPRPIVIPRYSELGLDIIQSNMRTAGMDRKKYFKLLAKV